MGVGRHYSQFINMSIKFSKHHFCIINNSRLEFLNSGDKVDSFIKSRLIYYKVGSYELLDNIAAFETRINNPIKDPIPEERDYIVISDIMNPFIDLDLVNEMTGLLQRTNKPFCVCEGAIPGTEIIGLISYRYLKNSIENFKLKDLRDHRCAIYRSNKQRKYNNQLNLYKYKRLKLFLTLIQNLKRQS